MCIDADECAYGGDGRGNLRENREARAPAVGIGGDTIAIRTAPNKRRPLLPLQCAYHPRVLHNPRQILHHDAARRVVFCLHAVPVDVRGRK